MTKREAIAALRAKLAETISDSRYKAKGIIYFTCTLIHKGFSIVRNILDLRGVLGENVVVGSTT